MSFFLSDFFRFTATAWEALSMYFTVQEDNLEYMMGCGFGMGRGMKSTIVFNHKEETSEKNSLGSRARKISRRRDSPPVFQDHGPPLQVRDEDSQQPCWDMHVMQVFNYKMMIDTVKGFGEVDKSHGHSKRFCQKC